MKVSNRGMMEIMSHEGICLEPYLDSVGVWTIGVGQTAHDGFNPRAMGKITIDQAIDLFKTKIVPYDKAVQELGLTLTQYQHDALVSLCYNFGPGNLRKLCNGRTLAQIGEAIMLYTKPKEITERRRKEQNLFKYGKYTSDGTVLVFPVSHHQPVYSKGYRINVKPYFGGDPKPVATKTSTAVVIATTTGTIATGINQGWDSSVWIIAAVVGALALAAFIYFKKRK